MKPRQPRRHTITAADKLFDHGRLDDALTLAGLVKAVPRLFESARKSIEPTKLESLRPDRAVESGDRSRPTCIALIEDLLNRVGDDPFTVADLVDLESEIGKLDRNR